MKWRWFITKNHLVWLIAVLVAALLWSLLQGCIPVTIRPEFDAQGKPKAIPVTPVGGQDPATGRFQPIYDVSDESPAPPTDWWPMIEKGAFVLLGLLTGTGGGMVLVRRAKTALKIACELADRNADAETDEQVAENKRLAVSQQIKAGVHDLTQKVRGKPHG